MTPAREHREATLDCGALYEQVRLQFVALLSGFDEAGLATPVPAAPEWSVHDVLAHVVGLAAALNAQDFPDADDEGGLRWNERVLAAGRGRPVAELAALWAREAPAFEDGLRLFGYEFGAHFFADLLVHLHDVQAALGLVPFADPLAVAVALDHYTGHLGGLLAAARWGTWTVVAGGESFPMGAGAERARTTAPAFDLLRALCARRSEAQLRALAWSGDVDGVVAFLRTSWTGGYSLPATDQP